MRIRSGAAGRLSLLCRCLRGVRVRRGWGCALRGLLYVLLERAHDPDEDAPRAVRQQPAHLEFPAVSMYGSLRHRVCR